MHSGSFATVAHPGISSRFELQPADPSLRFVSPHSTWVACRAPESSRRWRRSVVSRYSCLKCEAECSRSCRRSAYVLLVLRSHARPSSDTASEGHRMDHRREVAVRWRARWRSRAAACVGRSDFSMPFQSQSYAHTPFTVMMVCVSASSSVSPSVSSTPIVAPLRRSGSNAGDTPLASNSQPPPSSRCTSVGGRQPLSWSAADVWMVSSVRCVQQARTVSPMLLSVVAAAKVRLIAAHQRRRTSRTLAPACTAESAAGAV